MNWKPGDLFIGPKRGPRMWGWVQLYTSLENAVNGIGGPGRGVMEGEGLLVLEVCCTYILFDRRDPIYLVIGDRLWWSFLK